MPLLSVIFVCVFLHHYKMTLWSFCITLSCFESFYVFVTILCVTCQHFCFFDLVLCPFVVVLFVFARVLRLLGVIFFLRSISLLCLRSRLYNRTQTTEQLMLTW